ncbi:MAG: tyrosine-type recombinase/integrase [Polyangiales bacterium]
MNEAVDRYLAHLAGLRAPRTVSGYGAALAAFVRFIGKPIAEATRDDIERFLRRPTIAGAHRAANTWNQELTAVRAFFAFAEKRLGFAHVAVEQVELRRDRAKDPAYLSAPEVRAVLQAAGVNDRHVWRARDLALLVTALVAGLRVSEIARLDVNQVHREQSVLIHVLGKGSTVKDLALNDEAMVLLNVWLTKRDAVAREGESALFVSSRGTRISVRSIQRLVTKLARRARLTRRLSPHGLRHSLATLLIENGTDLVTVSEIMRHRDVSTTQLYVHLASPHRRAALARLSSVVPASLLPPTPPTSPTPPPVLTLDVVPDALSPIAGLAEGAANKNAIEALDVHTGKGGGRQSTRHAS